MIRGRCGELTENPCICGDCDVTYATLSSTCRECGFFICDPELVLVPREKQHSADCSLAKSESYGPRNTTELWSLDKEAAQDSSSRWGSDMYGNRGSSRQFREAEAALGPGARLEAQIKAKRRAFSSKDERLKALIKVSGS